MLTWDKGTQVLLKNLNPSNYFLLPQNNYP